VLILTPMTTPATPNPRFDTFYRYEALTRLLFDYAQAHPDLLVFAVHAYISHHSPSERSSKKSPPTPRVSARCGSQK